MAFPTLFRPLTREGPGPDELRIIGVELAATGPMDINGQNGGEVELEMFACQHTIKSAPRSYMESWRGGQVRVTLHTSAGDVTLRGQLPLPN